MDFVVRVTPEFRHIMDAFDRLLIKKSLTGLSVKMLGWCNAFEDGRNNQPFLVLIRDKIQWQLRNYH